jgi:outer membrane protein assembly factor BamB
MRSFVLLPIRALFVFLLILVAASASAKVKTGTYTGNATASRSITGIGFTPVVVIIKGNDTDATDDLTSAVLRSATMPGAMAKPLKGDQALLGNLILSLDADGFTVGSDRRVNAVGIQFHYVAFDASPSLKLGTYAGNGGSQSVSNAGFNPDYLVLMEDGASRAMHHSYHWNQSYSFNADASVTNAVTSLNPDGFTLGNNVHVNEGSRTYHYVAWQEVPGQMRVSWYFGDGNDNRSVVAGLRPEYVIVKEIDGSDEAFQRFSSMTGDVSVNFKNAVQSNRIQALQTNGFQVGTGTQVNNGSRSYFFAAFGNDPAPGLGTTEGPGTLTVTAPDYFDLTFSTSAGGGVQQFRDLTSGPNSNLDLAGGLLVNKSLFFDTMAFGGFWYNTGQNDVEPEIDLLEATPTRVKVRQESFYQREGGTPLLSGVKGLGDYTIYPSGRMALRWDRRTTKSVTNQFSRMGLSAHKRNSGYLSPWVGWSETAAIPVPGGPGTDLFVMAAIDDLTYGTYTDFLQILHQRWVAADTTEWFDSASEEWGMAVWQEADGQTLPALERWDSMIHFKPTDFVDRTDANVLERRDDYRSPDTLSILIGAPWFESPADSFNESEGAYTLTLDPSFGLLFDMNGSVVKRRQPFFKIRQWRSLQKPAAVTLEGVPLTPDLDYRADVKPVSRAHFATDLLWHSTLNSGAEVTNPDVGSPGAVNGGTAFAVARYGNGASMSTPSSNVSFPAPVNLRVDRGAVELWYLPSYYYVDGTAHRIWSYLVDASNQFHLTKEVSNNLAFEILRGGVSTKVSVTPANYGWLDYEWVHLRVTWDASAAVTDQARIFVNRVEPPHTSPTNAYNAALMPGTGTVLIGGSGGLSTDGIVDEFHVYGSPASTTDLAHGGLASNPFEFLATASQDFIFPLTVADSLDRGGYLYFGADSTFRGLNVSLSTPGAGAPDLAWEYWDGARWADLESGLGFTDETNHLTRNGSIHWSGDPFGWSELSVDGDVDLYYVRAHLGSGAYATFPTEKEIRTDILLFQYTKDISAAAQTFSFGVPPPFDVSISSASNQSFVVGTTTPVSPATINVTDLLGGSITAADDIRIRIPSGFPLRWDASVASASLAGAAAGKVNPTIKAYEDLEQTLVLDVVASFAVGDQLVISGLGFEGFLHPAPAGYLELEVDDDGSVAAFDDKTLTVTAGAAPNLSSFDNQLFTVGQPPTAAQTLYVTEGLGGGVLTAANDFTVEIPASFPMEWDGLVTTVGLSGPGASRMSATVIYPSTRIAQFNVTANFLPGEHVVITGLQFKNFSAPPAVDNLRLHSPPSTGVDADDKTIRVEVFADAPFFTATATDLQVRLEWVNPYFGDCVNVHLVRKEGSFPANPFDDFPVVSLPCVGGNKELVDDVTGLSNGTTYYYALFVEHALGLYTPGKFVKARPFDTSGPVKWAYSTGATSMAPPGLRFFGGSTFVYAVSNDNILHAMSGGAGGGSWPAGWSPYAIGAPAQSRPPVVGFAVGSSPQGVALLGSQNGSVHAVNAESGAPEWVESIATMVQAAPAGNFKGFDPTALDFVLVGTRNSSAANALVALDVVSGNPQWSFDNSIPQNGDGLGIGIISSSAAVHYATKRIYFASRARSGGSSDTVWAVNFAANPPQLLWSAPVGNVDGSPVLFGSVLYVGTNSGELYALDVATGDVNWSLPLGDGAVKGFVFPNFGTGDLFLATGTRIWSVSDNGTSAAVNPGWPVTSADVPSPSTPIVIPGATNVLAGGSDGRLYQLDTVSPLPSSNVSLGDGTAAVGVPTIDLLNSMAYVGTDQGVIYGVLLPLP